MQLEQRVLEVSKDNFNAAIETMLRSFKGITNDQEIDRISYAPSPKDPNMIDIIINLRTPQEVQAPVDQSVH